MVYITAYLSTIPEWVVGLMKRIIERKIIAIGKERAQETEVRYRGSR